MFPVISSFVCPLSRVLPCLLAPPRRVASPPPPPAVFGNAAAPSPPSPPLAVTAVRCAVVRGTSAAPPLSPPTTGAPPPQRRPDTTVAPPPRHHRPSPRCPEPGSGSAAGVRTSGEGGHPRPQPVVDIVDSSSRSKVCGWFVPCHGQIDFFR